MKVLSILALSGLAAMALPQTEAVSGRNKPGYCDDDKDCLRRADGYTCVSVQTTRARVEDVKQCLPIAEQICTGTMPGLCPSFSTTWGTDFRAIASVCSFIYPSGKKSSCLEEAAKNGKAGKKGVECLWVEDPEEEEQVGVIYGCVDFDGKSLLFEKGSESLRLTENFNYTAIIEDKCINPKNPDGASFVCSSQGTCAPTSAGQMDYRCSCNVGFSGTYCEKIVNNKCYNDGVCGGGTCDLDAQECTDCPLGTTGDKCAFCDPGYESPCNGHGKCLNSAAPSEDDGSSADDLVEDADDEEDADEDEEEGSEEGSDADDDKKAKKKTKATRKLAASDYQCVCEEGWTDAQCDVKVKSATKAPAVTPEDNSAASLTASLAVVAAAAVLSAF